jgi:hypothetical protein
VIVAIKVIGRTKMDWLRKDRSSGRQSRAQIMQALEGSLKRLSTENRSFEMDSPRSRNARRLDRAILPANMREVHCA